MNDKPPEPKKQPAPTPSPEPKPKILPLPKPIPPRKEFKSVTFEEEKRNQN